MKLTQFIKNNIPNSITCLNLLSGCLACIFTFRSQETFGALMGYELVFLFIGAAAVFDFFDGFAARMLHAYSSLGKELDSLADLISFGLAPALLLFNTMQHFDSNNSYVAYIALFLAVFAALRLAKFNIDDRQTTTFIGLPVPANAIFWIGFCAWLYNHSYIYPGPIFMTALIGLFSFLMVSRIRMFSLKFKNVSFADNVKRYFIIIGAILFVIAYQVSGFAWTIVLYLSMSILSRRTEESK